jgi:energy-coupling factor transporter ATP-binding protein EcfA2
MAFNLRAAVQENKKLGGEVGGECSFTTGLDVLDFMIGGIHPETKKMYVGIPMGRPVYIIGKSGAGKSTLAMQIADAIVEPYANSVHIIDDFERAFRWSRLCALTGKTEETLKSYTQLKNDDTLTAEMLPVQVQEIAALKKAHRKDLMEEVFNPWNGDQEPDYAPAPTVITIDSLKMMRSGKWQDSEAGAVGDNNMSGSQAAKVNSEVYSFINTYLLANNIIPISVNHISKKINTGYLPEPAMLQYLKVDESLPGGSTPIYLADTLLRVETKTKLSEDKEFGIKGHIGKITAVKSRSNAAGTPFDCFVYEQKGGFCNILTNFVFLKQCGHLRGTGRGYFFEGAEDIKFTQKTYRATYLENETLQQAVEDLLVVELPKLLGDIDLDRAPTSPSEI